MEVYKCHYRFLPIGVSVSNELIRNSSLKYQLSLHDLVQSQQSPNQPQTNSVVTNNQSIRQPIAPLINQISRRPSITPEGSQFQTQILSSQNPQQAVSVVNQLRAPVQQSIPTQVQRPNIQQLQSHQIQSPRIIAQQPQIQQSQIQQSQLQQQQFYQQRVPNSNPNQGPNQPINRLPIAQQQRFPNLIPNQGPNQQINRLPVYPIPDGRLINPQYRPRPRPIYPNIQSIQIEKSRMADINVATVEKNQPSYIISNADDVDDVIVRPISQLKMDPIVDNEYKPKVQPPSLPRPIQEPKTVPNPHHFIQTESIIPKPVNPVQLQIEDPFKTNAQSRTSNNIKSPTENTKSQKPMNRETNGKSADEPANRSTHSRASSHKSQEDVTQRSSSRSRIKLLEKPVEPQKKVSMNKIKVGNAPAPNLREVRSKIGSLSNAAYKPGGGNVKIESKKIEFNVQSRIAAKNETYTPGGGEKKIISNKLQWNARSKIGSLKNANHKPGGGDKKVLNFKTDYGNAKPKVGSKETNDKD